MNKTILNTWRAEILAFVFILLFTYTAIDKLLDYANFKALLTQSPIIGKKASVAAWLLPSLELLAALLLFFPTTRRLGFKITLGLMSLFTLYVAYMLLFVPNLPCSCGGIISSLTWKQHLLFNVVMTVLSVFGIWRMNKHKIFIAINRSSRTPV